MGLLQQQKHSLLVFEEHPYNTNEHWLTDLPVMACRKYKVGPTPVLCSGGTMGTRDGILDYLRVMAEEYEYWISEPNCWQQGYGDDQLIHNYLYYTRRFNNVKALKHRTGPIHVVGFEASQIQEKATKEAESKGLSSSSSGLPDDYYVTDNVWQKWLPDELGLLDQATGMIVNVDGAPSAQVHQCDRFGVLQNRWFQEMQERGWPYNDALLSIK